MKLKKIILLLFITYTSSSQSTGVLVMDFNSNTPNFSMGEQFRKTTESLFSNAFPNIQVVERSKISSILELVQDEQNLRKDFNKNYVREKLELASVEYVVYGDFFKYFGGEIDFQLKLVKASGKDLMSTESIYLRFQEKDLLTSTVFEKKLTDRISNYSLSKEYGFTAKALTDSIEKKAILIEKLNSKLDSSIFKVDSLQNKIKELSVKMTQGKFKELSLENLLKIKSVVDSNKTILLIQEIEFSYEPKINPELKKFIFFLEKSFATFGLNTKTPKAALRYMTREPYPLVIYHNKENDMKTFERIFSNILSKKQMYYFNPWDLPNTIIHFYGSPIFEEDGKLLIE